MASAFVAPSNSDEIVDTLSTLTFKQRLQYASDIGRKCENADDLINQLRNNPPPDIPQLDLDEGLCAILAPQERNVSKFYHQHQIALTAAVSRKTPETLELLKNEIKSQSKFFKKYTVKHYIKQQSDDAEIVALVKSVPPSVQKLLIHGLVKAKRTGALDVLADEMRKIAGVDYIIDFLHGCSSKKVRESLDYKNIFQHQRLRWDKIFRFHQEMIIEMMQQQLDNAKKTWGRYNAIYSIWTNRDKNTEVRKHRLTAWEEMLQTNTYQSGALWKLAIKYPHAVIDPCLTWKEKHEFEKEIAANDNEVRSFNDLRIKRIIPDFIKNRFNYFTRRNPDLFIQFVKETTVLNLRQVIRHSVPGRLWSQKDFNVDSIFEIFDICKALSTRQRLWPYHYMADSKAMSHWSYNIYTQRMQEVIALKYGSKMGKNVGFDHLIICQISRAKSQQSVFYSFSPRQMTRLINYIYDWMIEMKPKGNENDLYDYMGWIELLNQWTHNWLVKLYTKREKKSGTNRYAECIELLTSRWLKCWDSMVSCPWREAYPSRMGQLELLVVRVYEALTFWTNKCEHDQTRNPSEREKAFAKQLSDLISSTFRSSKRGGKYYHRTEMIKKLVSTLGDRQSGKGWLGDFETWKNSFNINEAAHPMYRHRSQPLRDQLNSLWSELIAFMKEEVKASHAFDYFVTFHLMRVQRKMQSDEKYQIQMNLMQMLYDRRPVFYELNPQRDAIFDYDIKYRILKCVNHMYEIYRDKVVQWNKLNEEMIQEIWIHAMDRRYIMTPHGWTLAKSSMDLYLKEYQYSLEQNILGERLQDSYGLRRMRRGHSNNEVYALSSSWFKMQSTKIQMGHFKAGGNNVHFTKKKVNAPSIVRSVLEFIKNRKVGESLPPNTTNDAAEMIPLSMIREMYDYYLSMMEGVKPPTARHPRWRMWVDQCESSQRDVILHFQQHLNKFKPQIEKWDEAKADGKVIRNIDATSSDDDTDAAPPARGGGMGRGRGRGRGYRSSTSRARGIRSSMRSRRRRGGLSRPPMRSSGPAHLNKGPHVIPPSSNLKKRKNSRSKPSNTASTLSFEERRVMIREGVDFINQLFPTAFDALLTFYAKPARTNWESDRVRYEVVAETLRIWVENQSPSSNARQGFSQWTGSDKVNGKWLDTLQYILRNPYAFVEDIEKGVMDAAADFCGKRCNSINNAQKMVLPRMHADNQTKLRDLYSAARNKLNEHVASCSYQDRSWWRNMTMSSMSTQLEYDCIHTIFIRFRPVFEETQYWKSYNSVTSVDYRRSVFVYNCRTQLTAWRSALKDTMRSIATTLTSRVTQLEEKKMKKIDAMKKRQHKATKQHEGTQDDIAIAAVSAVDDAKNDDGDGDHAMDIDDDSSKLDGTFETMEMTRINGWISEIIGTVFAFEFNEKYTAFEVKVEDEVTIQSWWEPDTLGMFSDFMRLAPNDDFKKLFALLRDAIVTDMKTKILYGTSRCLPLLLQRMKSKMRCEHHENWMTLWECLLEVRSKLEKNLDAHCVDLMINPCTTTLQREVIFKEIATEDHLKVLCNQRPATFVSLFGALCDFPNRTSNASRELANQYLNFYLDPEEHNASPDTKDQLLRYLDVRDHRIRKRLAKLTDSNSVDEREAGYRTLITATLLVNDGERDVQIKRTVKFFMTKLKNEAIDRREMGLEILFGELKSQNSLILESAECLQYLTEMLQDCLEVQDLDKGEDAKEWENITEHRVLRHFYQLSVDAIELGARDLDGNLFEFGVELQWKMCVFRKGNTEAAEQFQIELGDLKNRHKVVKEYEKHIETYGDDEGVTFDKLFFYEEEEDQFVGKYMKALEDRVKAFNPEWLDTAVSSLKYMEPLFLVLGSHWHKSKALSDLLEKLIVEFEDLEMASCLSEEGDKLVMGQDVEEATGKVITYIVEFDQYKWIDIEILGRFVTALFKALKVLHTEGYDDILSVTQKTLVFMVDAVLFECTKSESARKKYQDDWSDHVILKLLLDHCMEMLSVQYPQKENGRFWSMQWELHKVFRLRMMHCDEGITSILKVDDVNSLPTFKWSIFQNYWRTCLEGLRFAINLTEAENLKKSKNEMEIDDDEEKENELETATLRKGHKERVISLFKSDEERDIWRLELAVWTVDMACQWIWGGDWLEIAQSPVALLIQNSTDWRGFMVIPTVTVFSTVNKPLLRFRWHECRIISAVMNEVIRSLKVVQKKDIEGLRVFEKEHCAVTIFEKLIAKYHCNRSKNVKMRKQFSKNWYEIDMVNDYMNVMMRSRQIRLVLWRWWAHESTVKIEKKNGRKIVTKFEKSATKRTEAIHELLNITKSAIYLRFVWRHLLQYDQLRLTQFLESGSCFRGVFYLKPDDRKYTRKQQRDRESRKEEQAGRYGNQSTNRLLGVSGALKKEEIQKRAQRRGGGKEATRRVLKVQAEKRAQPKKVEKELSAMEQVEKEFEEQQKFEAAFEEWKSLEDKGEDETFDHRDIWCFEGCYQLNRLLPDQLSAIGKRHVAASLNTNRGMPERVKSIIRWTLLPTTTYGDIVQFFEDHKSMKLPINLLEALMKGVMENDEVLAPMHYLLQPKFLSSQQARIAAFAIQKCIPHIPRRQYTNLLRAVLSGKRRNALKVTAYKQIIRMLIQRPSRMHIQMVVHEWNRNEVHRDVRIVILQAAFDFIRRAKPISFGSEAAWHIFETAVTHPAIRTNIEIMTALMGCTIEGETQKIDEWCEGLVLKPRILDHLATFKETPIPKKHAARWAKIIVTLCDRVYTEWVDPEAKKEGTERKEDEEGDIEVEVVGNDNDGDGETTTMEVDGDGNNEDGDGDGTKKTKEEEAKDDEKETENKDEDDGSGPYLKNEGKPRCLDDIAFIAMRSLELWVKYNDSIVRDALRIVGETITDFSDTFVANENADVHKVNWKRFDMACGILNKTLKFSKSKAIRAKFLPVITDIVSRFDALINAPLERFIDIYQYGDDSNYTVSDRFAQSREYIGRIRRRLDAFFKHLGSFKCVPAKYYSTIIAPLDKGQSRGMYTDIVMEKRWEMMSNAYDYNKATDFVQDLLYYGCLDATFANNKVFYYFELMWSFMGRHKSDWHKLLTRLMTDNFPQRNADQYDPEFLESEQYAHLRHCMVTLLIRKNSVGGLVIQSMTSVFIEYFVRRLKLLSDSIAGPLTTSQWRECALVENEVQKEIDLWRKFIANAFRVKYLTMMNATIEFYHIGRQIYDVILKAVNMMVDYNLSVEKELTVSEWVYLQLFHDLLTHHTGIIAVLFGSDLMSLMKMPIFLAERKVAFGRRNPFQHPQSVVGLMSRVWSVMDRSYFWHDWQVYRSQLVQLVWSWFLDQNKMQQKKLPHVRRGVVAAAVVLLQEYKYQELTYDLNKDRFLKIWNILVEDKTTIRDEEKGDDDTGSALKVSTELNDDNDGIDMNEEDTKESEAQIVGAPQKKVKKETDPVLVGKIAVSLHSILQSMISFINRDTEHRSYDTLKPIIVQILKNALNDNRLDQRIFVILLNKSPGILTYILHDRLQQMFNLAIQFTVDPPMDGLGGMTWSSLADLIQRIVIELSPQWEKYRTMSHSATQLVTQLFTAFTDSPLVRLSELEAKPKVYRNVCLHLLTNKVHFVQTALNGQLAAVLKYLIELYQEHRNATRRNPQNKCYESSNPQSILLIHVLALNNQHNIVKHRKVNAISGALICQLYKDALDETAKTHEVSAELLCTMMSEAPLITTNAMLSPDLVNMVSWSIDYKPIANMASVAKYIRTMANYLSPTFDVYRDMTSEVKSILKMLMEEYCDWTKIRSPRTKKIGKILCQSDMTSWMITIAPQETMNVIYALSIQHVLGNLSASECINMILKWISVMESESKNLKRWKWKMVNMDDYTRSGNERPHKKSKREVDAIYTKCTQKGVKNKKKMLRPETLQIIHRIFQKKLVDPLPEGLESLTQNAIWNDFMHSLMTRVMNRYTVNLMDSEMIDITNTFFVSLISDISRAPLRFKLSLKQQLMTYFTKNGNDDEETRKQWIHWMLQYRQEMDRSSRDILTRLALSLVIKFGHDSCYKCGRIKHFMEKQKNAENEDGDTKMDDDEDKDDVPEYSKWDWTQIKSEESDDSFESEADDSISFSPVWVDLLNNFMDDQNPVIRMAAKKVTTVFQDWDEHKKAKNKGFV